MVDNMRTIPLQEAHRSMSEAVINGLTCVSGANAIGIVILALVCVSCNPKKIVAALSRQLSVPRCKNLRRSSRKLKSVMLKKTKVMDKEIKEIERLFTIHDDLDQKKKKIDRLIKDNFETAIDLDEQKRQCEKLIEGNLEMIKLLTKNQK